MAELVVPELGESITEAVVAKWLKRIGEHVAADEPLVDLETDKVTVQLPAPAAGTLREQRAAEGETVAVGQVIGVFDEGAAASGAEAPKKPQVAAPVAPAVEPVAAPRPVAPARVVATAERTMTPSQRRAAREGVAAPPAAPATPAAPAAPATPVVAGEGERVVPMSTLRKRIAERLVEAQRTAAILTTFNEIDMSNVVELRAHYKQEFLDKHGVKLGFMSLFIKACVAGLRRFPAVNAEVRGDSIVYKERYHIGVAVGGGKGLVVPVVRDVDRLSLAEIEKAIADLAQRARDNKLVLDELLGGTFTISNGGIYGSMMSTPLLNMPQTGILGMHNIVRRPVAVGDAIEIRPMMYIALSYDHRVVDGREAVRFLVTVKDHIENPDKLLFDL